MENPWGEPSPPLASASAAAPSSSTARRDSTESHASNLDDDAERAPTRLSLELVDEDDDAPAWDAHDDSPDRLDDDADKAWANEARASMRKVNDMTLAEQATEGEQARDAAGLATSLNNGDEEEEEEETTQVAEPPAAPAPPIPVVPSALPGIDAGQQQMDDFPEDDDDNKTKDGGGDDDFDDFGDTAGAGDEGDDDFGDFGDFGDAAPLDEAAFEAAPATTTTPLPSTSLASASPFSSHQQPFASTSAAATVSYPPLQFDVSGDPSRQSISSQLHDFWQGAFPAAANAVSDEPERQVEGVAQVLVSESSRSLWSELSTLPPLRPVDWRRSRIRREHLISMGFPVSQEEEAPLPSMTAQTSPNPAFSAPARPSSAPPPASSSALLSSQNGFGRPSTPLGTTTTTTRGGGGTTTSSSLHRSLGPAGNLAPAQPPPFDRERAEQALAAADLSLRSLDELRQLDAELDRISVDASELLTHALMMREKETQDKEVYNGMIQDLVIAAAKMKTSSAISSGAGKEPKRSGSGRWKLSK